MHSWSRTQDEGWWRAAFDAYGIPYTYFADLKLKEGNLRAKYDVIVFPHVGGNAISQVNGTPMTGNSPLPYKKTAEFPNLGYVDQSDDIRGGMGLEGLAGAGEICEAGRNTDHRRIHGDYFPGLRDHYRSDCGASGGFICARIHSARKIHG